MTQRRADALAPATDKAMHDTVGRLARGFAADWLRPSDPDHATAALVDTLSTAMLAFHAVARGVEQRACADALEAPPTDLERIAAFCEQTVRDGILPTLAWFEETAISLRACADATTVDDVRLMIDTLLQRRGKPILDFVRKRDGESAFQIGLMLDDLARALDISSPSLPHVPIKPWAAAP